MACLAVQSQQQMERDVRHMESVQEGMTARGDPLLSHYNGQVAMMRQRMDQMGDMYIGLTTAISVRAALSHSFPIGLGQPFYVSGGSVYLACP